MGEANPPKREGRKIERPTIRSTAPPPPPKRVDTRRSFRRDGRPADAAAKPKRVRGGVKLRTAEGETPTSWIAQRFTRVIELTRGGEAIREGLEYARLGQTKSFTLDEGVCRAVVQGRADKPYRVRLSFEHFTPEQTGRIVESMLEQPRLVAKLLAGELPANVEDFFAPLGLKLLPTEPGEVEATCTCADWSERKPWCKHVVCAAAILGEKLGEDPFGAFDLRGLPRDDLTERLREHRALTGQGPGPALVYSPHVEGASTLRSPDLEQQADSFWDLGPTIDEVDTPFVPPEVSHVLLRRLGASPFPGRFPLVGLLATCYEMIAREGAESEDSGHEPGGPDDAD